MSQDNGILYIATGDEFRKSAIKAAERAKSVTDYPVAVISDEPIGSSVIDIEIVVDDATQSFEDKPKYMSRTPFEKTVFLDTDTYLAQDISDIFELLDEYGIVAAVDPNEIVKEYHGEDYFNDIPQSFPEFNTGVVGFGSQRGTKIALDEWEMYYSPDHINDQPSFRQAVYNTEVEIAPLAPTYNCIYVWPSTLTGDARIFHGFDGSKGAIPPEKAAELINSREGTKVWRQYRDRIVFFDDVPLCTKVRAAIRVDGVFTTIRKLIDKGYKQVLQEL